MFKIFKIFWIVNFCHCWGFFDFLEDIPFIGPLIGGAADYFTGERTNDANAEQAALNRQFQERMSSTSYQRATSDMRAAGLNPMLAYQQGGASSPGGSTATMQNYAGQAINTGLSIAMQKAQIDKVKAETENVRASKPGVEAESSRLAYELENLVDANVKIRQYEMQIRQTEALMQSLHYNYLSRSENAEILRKHFEAQYSELPATVRQRLAAAALDDVTAKYMPFRVGAQAAANLASGAGSVARMFGRGAVRGARGFMQGVGKASSAVGVRRGYGKSITGRPGRPISDVDLQKELRKER